MYPRRFSTPPRITVEHASTDIPETKTPDKFERSATRLRTWNWISGSIIATTIAAIHPAAIVVYDEARQAITRDCPDLKPLENNNPAVQRSITANMEFGMSYDEFVSIQTKLREADSIEDVTRAAQPVFQRYDMDFNINRAPKAQAPGIFGSSLVEFKPANQSRQLSVSVPYAKETVNSMLLSMSQIPASFLRLAKGTDIYVFSGLKSQGDSTAAEGEALNGEHYSGVAPYSGEAIAIVAKPRNGRVFKHELGHAIQQRLCGDVSKAKSHMVTDANPRGFLYTNNTKDRDRAAKAGYTVTAYAASAAYEDFAETNTALLNGSYTPDPSVVTNRKMRNVTAMLENVQPGLYSYYRYASSQAGRPFPGDAARGRFIDPPRNPAVKVSDYSDCYELNGPSPSAAACPRPKP